MKNYLYIAGVLFLSACNFKKISNITIINKNNYPIKLCVYALNINYCAAKIAANATHKGVLDFTNISKAEGNYLIVIKHLNNGITDSFNHGYISNGMLGNYTNLQIDGHELKIEITE